MPTEATAEQKLSRAVLSLLEGQCDSAVQDKCHGSNMKSFMELSFAAASSILLLESREDLY